MDKTVGNGDQARELKAESDRGSSDANLQANLTEGAALLIAPPLHASPVGILYKRR
jgi:hypothetical protein